MATHEQIIIREAVEIIQRALRAVGSSDPVQLIDHDTAIRVGTSSENFVVRHHNQLWKVTEYTPYFQRVLWYSSIEACAHDIALCEPGVVFTDIDQTEADIDRAILDAEIVLHKVVG